MPTTTPTPWKAEWWHNKGGVQHYYTREEIAAAEARIKAPKEEPIELPTIKRGKREFSLHGGRKK